MEIMNMRLYDLKETAAMLGVTERTLLKYIYNNKIKGQKLRKKWVFTEENIKKFLSGN